MTPEDLLNKEKIRYLHSGRDLLVQCLNPEHDDSNPSMRVDKVIGVFNCLSCGFKGNIFTYFGESPKGIHTRLGALKDKILRKRTESIGLSMPKGYVDYTGSWRGISSETYQKFEAFEHADPDFVSRVNFPIRDISGRIAAFVGRHTGDGLPRYKIQPPRAQLPLYPMQLIRPIKGRVILVEGIYDLLRCYDGGLTNTLCCFGTKMVTEKKLNLLKLSGVTGLDIMFDNDDAGKKAAEGIKEIADKLDLDTRIIKLKVKDPGSLSNNQIAKLKEKLYG